MPKRVGEDAWSRLRGAFRSRDEKDTPRGIVSDHRPVVRRLDSSHPFGFEGNGEVHDQSAEAIPGLPLPPP